MIDEKLTRTTGALLVAVRDHVEQLVGGNHVDPGQLRLTVAARQVEAKKLVDAGMSLRQAAKQLGVGKSTVQEDVSGKRTRVSGKRTPKKPRIKLSDPEEERKQKRWCTTRNLIDGIHLLSYPPSHAEGMVADYDPKFAASFDENITPQMIRYVIAFLEELARVMELKNEKAA